MRKTRSVERMGLAILAGGLAFVGSADATELLIDGSFENTTGSSNPLVKVGGKANPTVGEGWSTFSTYLYSSLYALPGPAGSGGAFLRPYPSGTYGITQSSDEVSQTVDLTSGTGLTPSKIDAGNGRYSMSAWFSSYRTQSDYSDLTLDFLDNTGNPIESIPLGGVDFVAAIPTGANSKYPDARDWAQDVRSGTIPAGARTARVLVKAGTGNGAPDGYVDVVSLDVTDAGATLPAVVAADPGNNAVGAGPVVTLSLKIQDRLTAVDTNTINLFLDGALVAPSVEKVETNTTITYHAGVLPALSTHEYRVVYADTGTPKSYQTNSFRFTVANYLTLANALSSPLGSEDAAQPGFNVGVHQIAALPQTDPPINSQLNIPASMAFAEAVLAGRLGPNVATVANAAVPGTINWLANSGATANFPNDQPFPGIPGSLGTEDNFVHEIETFVRFPTAGFYQMGVNSEDHFRLSLATNGVQVLRVTSPTNLVMASVPIATNITQLQFGGSLPRTPLTAQLVYATPSGNPDEGCNLAGNTALAGKIALIDRAQESVCDSAAKAEQAQTAGAVAVLITTPGDAGYPFRLGDINPRVNIPVLVIGENFGGSLLKSYLNNGTPVTLEIASETSTIAEWDGPKGFGAVDVTFGFAVPNAGLYPMRLVAGQEAGPANLEWFSIELDGSRILINDTSNPKAIRTFRARTAVTEPARFNPVAFKDGSITLSWTGSGTLEESATVGGGWTTSPNQGNPQTVPATGPAKFFRIRQ